MSLQIFENNIFDNSELSLSNTEIISSESLITQNNLRIDSLDSLFISENMTVNHIVSISFNQTRNRKEFTHILIKDHNLLNPSVSGLPPADQIVNTPSQANLFSTLFIWNTPQSDNFKINGSDTVNNDFKKINTVLAFKPLGAFKKYPNVSLKFSRSRTIDTVQNSKKKITTKQKAVAISLDFDSTSELADIELAQSLFNRLEDEPFYIRLVDKHDLNSVAESVEGYRIQDFYKVFLANDFEPQFIDSRFHNPLSFTLELLEVL